MCTRIYVYYYCLLLLLLFIINAQVVTVFTRWRFFYLFIYFEHLYIDHHLANIAHIGTGMVKEVLVWLRLGMMGVNTSDHDDSSLRRTLFYYTRSSLQIMHANIVHISYIVCK